MAKPTRKQPERRKSTSAPTKGNATKRKLPPKPRHGILLRIGSGIVRLALRNPAIFGGTAAFAVVFGFVAANALWYQPGQHPSPMLRTRLPLSHPDPARISLNDSRDIPESGKVTTFVIEREGEQAAAEPAPAPAETLPTSERTASVAPRVPEEDLPETVEPAADTDPASLTRAVQAELSRRGFYDGDADGRLGPKTVSAIRSFERSAGRPQSGLVSEGLLQALRGGPAPKPGLATITPAPRPTKVSADEGDAVAAAIRAADGGSEGAIPKSTTETGKPGMVMTIQRGLVNLAYADVTIDGVAGDQTRAAIRHFEKHYRLPETGEPSAAVMKKLKDIGAI